jgi:hypothetical protein
MQLELSIPWLRHITHMEPTKPPPPNARDLDPSQLIRFGGPIDRACVSLRVFGESLVPDEVTQLLGCQPTESRCKGDVIPDKRYHRVAKTGSWRLEGALAATTDIGEQLIALLAAVTSDLEVWNRLTAEFDVDIFCGVFLNVSNRGFSLTPQVSRMLSDRGIEVGFDIYCS